ncbi:hypothetical protein ACFRCG_39910 [Embleya sp. NPDC056575]|uniref:hypothetical protein n=1 Tax=unclassified Embleya TaxID=2699296 RepID=UPI0036AFFB83
MSLPLLASGVDLATYMQQDIDLAAAELALRTASAAIRRWTRQDITLVVGDVATLRGGERVLSLPQRPLVVGTDHPLTVVELAEWGSPSQTLVEELGYSRLGNELTRGHPEYLGSWRGCVWAPRVRVTYSHGYAEVPDDIAGVALDLAAATLANPNRLRSETVGGESVVYTVETFGTGSLTSSHREILEGYRRSAYSVRMR